MKYIPVNLSPEYIFNLQNNADILPNLETRSKTNNVPDFKTAQQAGDLRKKMITKDKAITEAAAVSVFFARLKDKQTGLQSVEAKAHNMVYEDLNKGGGFEDQN